MVDLVARWDAAVVDASDATDWWEGAANVEPRRSVLHEPATEDAILDLESRIGRRLPPSYRVFLEVSDGADASSELVTGPGEGFSRAGEVGWFIDANRGLPLFGGEGAVGWSHQDNDPCSPEVEWLARVLSDGAEPALANHLTHCIAVSPCAEKTAVLLNPLVQDADGEWQCIDFYTHDVPAGYRSFATFLESRIGIVQGWAAKVERRDDDDLATLDDATIERWLTHGGVEPPWFHRALRTGQLPAPLVTALVRLLDSSAHFAIVNWLRVMPGEAALTLAQAAWRVAREPKAPSDASAPRTRDPAGLLRELSDARDRGVRRWVVDTLAADADHLVDEASRTRLTGVPRAVVDELRTRPEAARLVAAMSAKGAWQTRDEEVAAARAQAAQLADPEWRAAHPREVSPALDAVARSAVEVLPALRLLRGVDGVHQGTLAAALFVAGDDDVDFLAQHLSLDRAGWTRAAPEPLRMLHRERRVAYLSQRDDLSLDEAAELSAAGGEQKAVDAILARQGRERTASAAADQLELLRTGPAIEGLVALSERNPHALRALARLGDPRCLPGLLALLAHDDAAARRLAARGLRELGGKAPVDHLVAHALGDPDEDVAWVAAHAAVVWGVEASALLDRLAATGDPGEMLVAHWRSLLESGRAS